MNEHLHVNRTNCHWYARLWTRTHFETEVKYNSKMGDSQVLSYWSQSCELQYLGAPLPHSSKYVNNPMAKIALHSINWFSANWLQKTLSTASWCFIGLTLAKHNLPFCTVTPAVTRNHFSCVDVWWWPWCGQHFWDVDDNSFSQQHFSSIWNEKVGARFPQTLLQI